MTSGQSSNGEAGNRGIEDGGSNHLQGSGREGDVGRRSEENGVLRAYATTMEYQVREDCVGAVAKVRQSVARNCAARSG